MLSSHCVLRDYHLNLPTGRLGPRLCVSGHPPFPPYPLTWKLQVLPGSHVSAALSIRHCACPALPTAASADPQLSPRLVSPDSQHPALLWSLGDSVPCVWFLTLLVPTDPSLPCTWSFVSCLSSPADPVATKQLSSLRSAAMYSPVRGELLRGGHFPSVCLCTLSVLGYYVKVLCPLPPPCTPPPFFFLSLR